MPVSIALALAAVTATCTPDPSLAQAGPERVRAFIDAVNSRDPAAIGRFIKPGASYANAQVSGMPLTYVMRRLLEAPNAERLDVAEAVTEGTGVRLRTRTPSGSTASAIIQLDGGCIAAFRQTE
jgi:hypothetical protein